MESTQQESKRRDSETFQWQVEAVTNL